MNTEELPDWLETLWNVNPSLALRAEEYLSEELIKIKFYKEKYEKCIKVIKLIDDGAIKMYNL